MASDYAYDFSAVALFFAGDPMSADAWRDTIARRATHARQADAVADLLLAQQRRRRAPRAALDATERLRDGRCLAVVTGQQAGLFGGPFFTLLKALTAIQLAERMSATHQMPAVPVFWIDAEDHDWEEVGACGVLDADLQYRSIELTPPPGAGTAPVAALQVGHGITDAIDQLQATLAPTEFTADLLDELRRAYQPDLGMTEAFGRWLEAVLGARGLVVFDSSDPAAKPLVSDIFSREVQTAGRTVELATAAGQGLVERGYHAQVTPSADSVALFRLDGVRRAIRRTGQVFTVGDVECDAASLAAEVVSHPARFSPNVLLRPVVQDTLFPTVCYVAGPSELAYLGQLRDIYTHFGVPMPLVYPRASATVVDSAAHRFLTRHGVGLEALQPRDEAVLNRLLEAQLPASVERSLDEAARAVRERMLAVIEEVPAVDPTLTGAAKSTQGRLEHDLHTLRNKILQAAKRRNETLRRQFTRAQAQAFPNGHPQERVVGFIYFLNRYGSGLLDQLAAALPIDPRHHSLLTP